MKTVTNQCKGVKQKMFKGWRNETFVCMDDVSDHMEDPNPVIYNPSKQLIPERTELLYRKIKERFGVELSSDELNHLTKYDVSELRKFVEELRNIIKNKK